LIFYNGESKIKFSSSVDGDGGGESGETANYGGTSGPFSTRLRSVFSATAQRFDDVRRFEPKTDRSRNYANISKHNKH
jgi:hypothetical protein